MSNVEGMYSIYYIKTTEQSETTLRYSAVRCSNLIQLSKPNEYIDPRSFMREVGGSSFTSNLIF